MKRFIVFVVAIAFVATVFAGAVAKRAVASTDQVKLGYVDMNRALNEVNEGKAAKAKLEADGQAKKKKLEIMQNELKTMKEDLDKQRLILSKEALAKKEADFQQKFFELQKTTMEFEQSFAEKEANFIRPISEKLQGVIQKIGQAEGYSLIVPRAMALYSLPGTDLTDKVIAAYNTTK
ncbi:MAG: OmpH family outer membrane protein [Pseudomonadota bacterium]